MRDQLRTSARLLVQTMTFSALVIGLVHHLLQERPETAGRSPAAIRKPAYVPVRLESPKLFSKHRLPTDEPPRIIGKHWSGCLEGAHFLEPQGLGFQRMRLSRNRGYGHPELIKVVRDLALRAQRERLGTLFVGDLSQARGGPMVGGHRSHQTGLDGDIWFATSKNFNGELSARDRETISAIDMLAADGRGVSKVFSDDQRRLLEIAAKDPRIQRVFVHPHLKKALCEIPKNKKAYWMRKIRPAFGHNYHFHIRLACPRRDAFCFDQAEMNALESGCDAELASWFTADGRVVMPPASKEEAPYFVPRECLALAAVPDPRGSGRLPSSHEILTREADADSVD